MQHLKKVPFRYFRYFECCNYAGLYCSWERVWPFITRKLMVKLDHKASVRRINHNKQLNMYYVFYMSFSNSMLWVQIYHQSRYILKWCTRSIARCLQTKHSEFKTKNKAMFGQIISNNKFLVILLYGLRNTKLALLLSVLTKQKTGTFS